MDTESGAGVAVLTFLFRQRIAVLSLLALAAVAALVFAFYGHAVPVGALFLSTVSLAIGTVMAFVGLRHGGLAALAALAPLPGMIGAGPFALAAGVSFPDLLAVYGLAYLFSVCLCGDIVRRILAGTAPIDASRESLAEMSAPIGLAVLIGIALILGWLVRDARLLGIGGAAGLAAGAVSVLVIVSFAASVLSFGENFFVRANRARETRESLLRLATLVIEPRWGMSLSGIALVFATLGGFGAEPVFRHSVLLAQPALWGASVLLLFLATYAVGRDWREALAATLALAALALLSLVVWGRAAGHLTITSFIEIAAAQTTALFLILALMLRGRRYRRLGDAPAVARLRAIEDMGLTPWFGALGAAAVTAPWIVLHGSIATLAVMFLLAVAAALLAMPALATALHVLVPRRRSVDELYGRG